MHLRSLLLLFVVVAALAGLAFWQLREEGEQRAKLDAALLEGFDRGRVTGVRIDNLERSLQMRLERTSDGRWQIVDPLDFPADVAVMEALFGSLEMQRLRPPLVEDLSKLRLDPPRVVLEITETVSGKPRVTRIEIGEVDIGDQYVYVRRDGVLGRTERALDTVLERDLPGWRSHLIMDFDARSVVELTREGGLPMQGAEAMPVTLSAVLDGEWRATAPFVAQLDPRQVATLVGALAMLRAESFIDAPAPLEHYGLAQPVARIALVDARGATQAVRFAPEPQGEMWYVTREDRPYVYRVSSLGVGLCLPPSEGLVDRSFTRAARSEVTGLELAYEGGEISFRLDQRTWRVTGRRDGREVLSEVAADEALVSQALSAIEQARAEQLYFDKQMRAEDVRGRIELRLGASTLGGSLGAAVRTADGAEGVLFKRDGDELVTLLSPRVLELVRSEASAFQSLVLHKQLEMDTSYIEAKFGGVTRKWARDEHGHWARVGMETEAKEFARLVDRLLSMRATRMLRRGDDQVADPLEVRLATFSGAVTAFVLGRAQVDGAEAIVYRTGSQYAVVGPELYNSLAPLLAGD
jgi:hypothetical protein